MGNVIWVGRIDNCQSCTKEFDGSGPMYDARVRAFQCWANICEDCFVRHGCATGVGFGQKYELQDLPSEMADNVKRAWVKVGG